MSIFIGHLSSNEEETKSETKRMAYLLNIAPDLNLVSVHLLVNLKPKIKETRYKI